jgi:hypothetical protein
VQHHLCKSKFALLIADIFHHLAVLHVITSMEWQTMGLDTFFVSSFHLWFHCSFTFLLQGKQLSTSDINVISWCHQMLLKKESQAVI